MSGSVKNILRFSIAGVLLLLFQFVNALHIKGGWMNYRYIDTESNGNLRYEFTVKVFRDCGTQSPGQNDAVINITMFRNGDNTQAGVFAAGSVANYSLRKTTFNPCIQPVPDVCYVILEYRGIVSVPPHASGYTASFQRCCRINGIVNVIQPSNNLGNSYFITVPGTAQNPNFTRNTSPIFAENDTAIVCFNSSFTLDFSATDPDGDSLVYEYAPALGGASSGNPAPVVASAPPYPTLPYIGNFSPENPFGTGTTLDRRTGLITGLSPNQNGEYVVAVRVLEYRNGQMIAETRKELHVNVANCSLPEADLPREIVNCENFEVTLQNQAVSPAINSYFWDFGVPGDPNSQTDLFRATYTYKDTGTYTVKLVVNRGQPCTDSSFVRVRIYPGFNPGFVADGACFSNPFNFRDTTFARFGTVVSWRWDFGNPNATNDTSRQRNPAYTYPAPGNYPVTLRAVSNLGCDKTVVVPLQVFDRPFLNLPFRDTLICSIDTLPLRALGSGTFAWTPSSGTIIGANTPNPLVFPKTTTTYTVSLNDRGCVTSDSIRVNVLDFISVEAGRDTTICLGDEITLRPVTQGLSFRWSPAATLDNPNVRNPKATPTTPRTTYVVLANLGKCQDTDSVVITTVPYPVSNVSPDTTICFGDAAPLRGFGDGNRFQWVPLTDLSNSNTLNPIARPRESTTYTLFMYDDKGCPKPGTSTVTITVTPRVVVNAGRDTTIVFGQALQINASSNAPNNTWSPALGLSTTSGLNPVLTLRQQDVIQGTEFLTYRIMASTPDGCNAIDDLVVRIFSTGPSIFVPTAFTPNGDGLNDKIRPILAGIQKLEFFRVYNRYGQLVFESSNQESAWDGNFKGQKQPSGTFVFQVQAVDYLGEVLKKNGTFSLIR
jgi:gliding motility-associated-like protein